jgi:CheY-like chemotaxis protein
VPQLQSILCVDDEEDIQTVMRIALESVGGFETLACGSGEEALREAERFGPDLILLDVMMPGMDGPTVLRTLRRTPGTAHIPVIFVTARVRPPEESEYRAMGAADVIIKPFDPMTLPALIHRIWARLHG